MLLNQTACLPTHLTLVDHSFKKQEEKSTPTKKPLKNLAVMTGNSRSQRDKPTLQVSDVN